jgi:hypothetical protein
LWVGGSCFLMSQAKLLISVFLRLTFVSGWFVFSHVTSRLWHEKTRTTHSQASISKTQKSKVWLVTWENTNHPLTNVNLKNTEIKSLACDMRKHEPPTHKRKSQKHRNQKLGLWHGKTRTTHSQTSISNEIYVCEWVVRVFSCHKPSFWFLCFWDLRLWVGGSCFLISQAKLLISVFLRLTFVSGWFVFSHVTSQAFDFCVF